MGGFGGDLGETVVDVPSGVGGLQEPSGPPAAPLPLAVAECMFHDVSYLSDHFRNVHTCTVRWIIYC